MKEEAQMIGEQIVNLELQLENAFRSKAITKKEVDNMTNQISILDGKLRSVHIKAHIDMCFSQFTILLKPILIKSVYHTLFIVLIKRDNILFIMSQISFKFLSSISGCFDWIYIYFITSI
ncbi:hypothetical protein [Alkalihalobacterium alkalinitrilicum]|uniref:hypothetical protein n=1 Tax=Alkalihalobacterium alkalinitrilicum TaxID=427920 RepID=UPI000994D1FD|nr:hypothetical protein [Alkalihalobacterium alkalinitrilicum]